MLLSLSVLFILILFTKVPTSPKIDRKDKDTSKDSREIPKEGSGVTVVRTESHLARFNNARALFEKLGKVLE